MVLSAHVLVVGRAAVCSKDEVYLLVNVAFTTEASSAYARVPTEELYRPAPTPILTRKVVSVETGDGPRYPRRRGLRRTSGPVALQAGADAA